MNSYLTRDEWERVRREAETCTVCGTHDKQCRYGRATEQSPLEIYCRACDPKQTYNRFDARMPKADAMQEYHAAEYAEQVDGPEPYFLG